MADEKIESAWREGRPLQEGGYPGFAPGERIVDGVRIERDVRVAMRDGVAIAADIYRPDGAAQVPAIIAWSPYGKHRTGPGGFDRFPGRAGVPEGVPGEWATFEGPDPGYWCAHGYAVVNADARGSWMSGGDLLTVGAAEAQDIHDLVEWLAAQSWCSGRIAMSGNSWLAQCQWYAAATCPPHLAAIAPWEGWSDLYRDNVAPGGITTEPANWMEFVWAGLHSRTRVEDCPAMVTRYPLWNAYWQSKQAGHALSRVPAYVVASWNSRLHSRGSLEGFKQLGSTQKWLRIHDGWEWPDYYDPQNLEDLRRFFDHFLKDADNGWDRTPRVRLALMDAPRAGPSRNYREEEEWPLERTEHETLYLDAESGRMAVSPFAGMSQRAYDARQGSIAFDYAFGEDTELIGHMSLRLWVEARGARDMDLFVVAQKLGRDGARIDFRTYGVNWAAEPARGFLRASHRELDAERSTPAQPWHTHRLEQLLAPGEIVAVDIEFWPMGCVWHRGETLRIVVAGHPLLHAGDPVAGQALASSRNRGEHVIWTGGGYDSQLLVPRTPPAQRSARLPR